MVDPLSEGKSVDIDLKNLSERKELGLSYSRLYAQGSFGLLFHISISDHNYHDVVSRSEDVLPAQPSTDDASPPLFPQNILKCLVKTGLGDRHNSEWLLRVA